MTGVQTCALPILPTWVKVAIDTWTTPAGVVDGHVFRSVNRGGQVQHNVLSEKVVWQMLRPYAAAAGVPWIAPHDCRRTAAKLCRAAGGELEQIQLLLGHAFVQTTEIPRDQAGSGPCPERWDQITDRCITSRREKGDASRLERSRSHGRRFAWEAVLITAN